MFESIKWLLKANDKWFYSLITNKITEGKIWNFVECDMFIVISCPYSGLIDSEEYKGATFLTPLELLIGFNTDLWSQIDCFDFGNSK